MNGLTRGGAAAARLAHNQKVAGSNPAPATSRTRCDVLNETADILRAHGVAPTLAALTNALADRVLATEQTALANACFGFGRAAPVAHPRPPKPPPKSLDE